MVPFEEMSTARIEEGLAQARTHLADLIEVGTRNGAFTPGAAGERTVEANNRMHYRQALMMTLDRIANDEAELVRRGAAPFVKSEHYNSDAVRLARIALTASAVTTATQTRNRAIAEAVDHGLSMRAVAQAAGISHTQVQRIIKGEA